MPLPLLKRKELVNKLVTQKELFINLKENDSDINEINKCGNELLKLHLEAARLLKDMPLINFLTHHKVHNSVSMEKLDELIISQQNLIINIEESKQNVNEHFKFIETFFTTNLGDEKLLLLQSLEETLASPNKVIRKKSRKKIREYLETIQNS